MKAIAYCDGRGNCGTGACAAVITLEDGNSIEIAERLGAVTNNIAEYEAVLLAMRHALSFGVTDLVIHSDSQLIVYQINGKYRVKQDHLRPFRDRAREVGNQFESVSITWVPREQNVKADALCRKISKNGKNPFIRNPT